MTGVAPPRSETIPADRYLRAREHSQARPWSGLEAQERAEEVLDLLAEAVDAEMQVAIEAAEAEHAYRLARAQALATVGGRNADEREANVYLHLEEQAGPDSMNVRQARDYFAALHRSQREKVKWLQTEARLAQSLMVDARESGR